VTVLVTGASGFLGSHVTELLVERGTRPRVLARPGEPVPGTPHDAALDIHWADLTDRAALEAAVGGIDCIIHCAARTGPWGPQAEYWRTNVRGLETLVEVALAAGVRRIVHVSSITVHGNDVRGAADEHAPFREEPNPYSRSKVAGEQLLERMIRGHGAPVTIVRPGWIYGPGDTASFARLAGTIRSGRMVMIGSGENHLPLIYVRDAAEGILLASDADHAAGRAYLLVNDEPVTQRDYIGAIATELGVAPPTRHIPYGLGVRIGALAEAGARLARTTQPPPVMRYGLQLVGGENRFSISRARRELGFSPRVDLAEGIRRSIDWYRATHDLARAQSGSAR
jgi:nucleoside-diphosphate-sugar epimerase